MTSINSNQAANYGEERQPTDARYDRAHEFMEVCRQLWESWDEDAVTMDREAAVFADPAKVRRIEYEGRFFKSRGPLNVTRSPQNGPAIFQAGTSPKGQDFAAKYADAIFAIQPRAVDAAAYFASIKGRMSDLGRGPRRVPDPLRDATGSSGRRRQRPPRAAGGAQRPRPRRGWDGDPLRPPRPRPRRDATRPRSWRSGPSPSSIGCAPRFHKPDGTPMTVAEVAARHGQSVSLPQFAGTPAGVADQMEAFMEEVGGDGFMLSRHPFPGGNRGVRRPRGPGAPAARPLPHRSIGAAPSARSSARRTESRERDRLRMVAPARLCPGSERRGMQCSVGRASLRPVLPEDAGFQPAMRRNPAVACGL